MAEEEKKRMGTNWKRQQYKLWVDLARKRTEEWFRVNDRRHLKKGSSEAIKVGSSTRQCAIDLIVPVVVC